MTNLYFCAKRTGGRLAIAALLSSTAFVAAAHADTMAAFTFSGALSAQDNTLSGTIVYSYDANDSITAINSVSVASTAYGDDPGFTFSFNIPGVPDTLSPPPSTVVNDAANEVYAVQLVSSTDGHIFYPEWMGVGSLAELVVSSQFANDGFTSYGDLTLDPSSNPVSNIQEIASAGTTTASVVPEPASMALLGMGFFGIAAARRWARR